jgi:rhomboid protease GluP
MPTVDEKFLLYLLQACAAGEPTPLYPVRFARELNLERDKLDAGLDELRRRGLVQFTEWIKDVGQGYALTAAGRQALSTRRLTPRPNPVAEVEEPFADDAVRADIVRRGIFAPRPPYVVWLLLAANLLYFAFGAYYAGDHSGEYLQGQGKATTKVLRDLGALEKSRVFPEKSNPPQRPQFERILLFLFLHGGLFHLAMNMYFLFAIGRQIEGMWGSLRFYAIYLIAGIVSGCVVLLMTADLTIGASGALYGIFVAMVVWMSLNKDYLPDGLIQEWSRNLAVNMVLLIAINFLPGISWQGHFGGAVGGLLAALLLHVQRFHPWRVVRMLALAGVPLVPIGFFVAVLLQHAGWF